MERASLEFVNFSAIFAHCLVCMMCTNSAKCARNECQRIHGSLAVATVVVVRSLPPTVWPARVCRKNLCPKRPLARAQTGAEIPNPPSAFGQTHRCDYEYLSATQPTRRRHFGNMERTSLEISAQNRGRCAASFYFIY